ncbi:MULTISPECIES: glycoside hydrolase family 127 protein [Streptomyces]|uniref:glycoside hydrolase family 127 protein n=1 Tax=Streptomyces TaxID=1883 RepID=UPI0004CA1D0E|nr:beta-L-arabinofuranosidase domain-containing protein [Streptomyces sp. NRRL F-2890]
MTDGPIRLTHRAHARLRPADDARITGGFWAARRQTNAAVSIPQGPAKLEAAGNLANLRAAAGGTETAFAGDFPFQDSDVHKWLEAASWQLAHGPDRELEREVDRLIALVAAAQEPDGYLQTYYQVKHPERRWKELDWGHELYCAGHLIQAAVAHHRATGRTALLEVALRFAAHIEATFGEGRAVDAVCGHPEIETALVELYRETGERRWLDLAAYFVDLRGHGSLEAGFRRGGAPTPGSPYWQDQVPVREARTATGHAVRQLYLLAGAADLATETGEAELRDALARLWTVTAATKTYLTGGVGARHEGEAFGDAYELPPDRAYAETCAAIASVQFSWRMALLTGEARYSDLIERTLYNGFLSGVGLDGEHWLYVNPLQVREEYEFRPGDHTARRTPWFRCACCPPNVMRLLASLPHYMASGDGTGLQLHQYAAGTYTAGGGTVTVAGDYPWVGRIAITVDEAPAGTWTLALRVPPWADRVRLDGRTLKRPDTGWLRLERAWSAGERVVLELPLEVRFTRPDPRVDAVRGTLALERGPLVYCLEQTDLPPGVRLDALTLDPAITPGAEHRPRLLGGVTVLTAGGRARAAGGREEGWPYGAEAPEPAGEPVELTAVPYYAWANRADGAMRVWVPRA